MTQTYLGENIYPLCGAYNFQRELLCSENRGNSRETGSCTEKFLSMSRLRRLVNLETSFEYNAVAIATFTPGRERPTAVRRKKRV